MLTIIEIEARADGGHGLQSQSRRVAELHHRCSVLSLC